jgi:hypothetical protein
MAFIVVVLMLYLQWKKFGSFKFIYSYLPIFCKNIISVDRE